MTWIPFALLSAVFQATTAILSKDFIKDTNEYLAAFATRLVSTILFLPFLFFIEIPKFNYQLWYSLIIGGSFLGTATILFMRSYKKSDISLLMPMYSFTPLFVLILAPFIIYEYPNIYGLIGILLTVVGSYILNIQPDKNYFYPFKKLLTDQGVKSMLVVTLLWAINANFDRIGLENSSPLFWLISTNVFITIFLLPITLYKSAHELKQIPQKIRSILPISLANNLESYFYMLTIQYTLIAYAISIKRFSIIIGILAGKLLFKEKNIKKRLAGAIIMIMGVLFITLFD